LVSIKITINRKYLYHTNIKISDFLPKFASSTNRLHHE